jgi:hypothetical protein
VLWQGAPEASKIPSKQDLVLIPFSPLWGGSAIFWEIGVSSSGWGFATFWGVLFVCVGLYLIFGRFFYKRWDRRRTRYVLTNRRARPKWCLFEERRGNALTCKFVVVGTGVDPVTSRFSGAIRAILYFRATLMFSTSWLVEATCCRHLSVRE